MADRFRGEKKVKAWSAMPSSRQDFTVAVVIAPVSLGFTAPSSVIRMLGEYVVYPTASITANDAAKVTVGIGKVSTDAFSAGGAGIPDPAGDPSYSWLYWAAHMFSFAGTDPEAAAANYSVRRSFDIRSMRKVKNRDAIVVVAEYVSIIGAPPLSLSVASTRMLLGLH